MMWNSVGGSKVAAYLHTNVVSYKDNVALFQQAEKEFGGVDVSIREENMLFKRQYSCPLLQDCAFECWHYWRIKDSLYSFGW